MTRSTPAKHRFRHRLGDEQAWRCHYCERPIACIKCRPETTQGHVATFDHVHPRSKGGRLTEDNTVLACFTCNHRKADSILTDGDFCVDPGLTYTIGALL